MHTRERFRNPWIRTTAKAAVSALLLALVLQYVDRGAIWQILGDVHVPALLVSIALYVPAQLIAAYRWYYLLGVLSVPVSFWAVVRHNMLGQFAALFLPGQLSGDLVRTVAIASSQPDQRGLVFSVLIDKLALMLAVACFAFVGVLGSTPLNQQPLALEITALLFVAFLALYITCCSYRNRAATERVRRLCNGVPARWQRPLSQVAQTLDAPALGTGPVLVTAGLALLFQTVNTLGSYALASAMGISVSLLAWGAINAFVAVAQLLPFTIGGIGVREGVFAGALALYDTPVARSTAMSLTGFVLGVLLTSITWFVFELVYTSLRGRRARPAASSRQAEPRQ